LSDSQAVCNTLFSQASSQPQLWTQGALRGQKHIISNKKNSNRDGVREPACAYMYIRLCSGINGSLESFTASVLAQQY